MAVYLDPMTRGKRIRRAGPLWCHMIADSAAELHAMADRLGMMRSWFQASPPASFPHYDIGTPHLRARAVLCGAVECDRRTFVEHLQRIRWDAQKAASA